MTTKPFTGDAFEDVLYGSESELEDSDDEEPSGNANGLPKKKNIDHGARLRIDDDEPMDLLQGASSRITSEPLVKKSATLFSYTHPQMLPGLDAVNLGKMLLASRQTTILEK